MIVVAIIGIFGGHRHSAYQDYTIRAKVTEGLGLASSAEIAVADGFQSNGMIGVATASTSGPQNSWPRSTYRASRSPLPQVRLW